MRGCWTRRCRTARRTSSGTPSRAPPVRRRRQGRGGERATYLPLEASRIEAWQAEARRGSRGEQIQRGARRRARAARRQRRRRVGFQRKGGEKLAQRRRDWQLAVAVRWRGGGRRGGRHRRRRRRCRRRRRRRRRRRGRRRRGRELESLGSRGGDVSASLLMHDDISIMTKP